MEILVVATKVPWPSVDGGRLALANTVAALVGGGARVRVVAPGPAPAVEPELPPGAELCRVPAGPRSAPLAALAAVLGRRPLTVARHEVAAVAHRVEEELARRPADVVHVEQVQALAGAEPARRRGVPVVLRQQNLEHRLWHFSAASRSRPLAMLMRREAQRLARFETAAMTRVAVTVAITGVDEGFLRALAPAGARIETVEVPFPAELEAVTRPLAGSPPLTLLASGRWRPNQDLVASFVGHWWPRVAEVRPSAVLHLFGHAPATVPPGVVVHGAPEDSAAAFPRGSVTVIPARHDTGVPMKGLEAWARGAPVVASPEAAASLDAEDGRHLVVAADPEGLAAAVARLAESSTLWRAVVDGGRSVLGARHAPGVVARRWLELYREVAAASAGARTGGSG